MKLEITNLPCMDILLNVDKHTCFLIFVNMTVNSCFGIVFLSADTSYICL